MNDWLWDRKKVYGLWGWRRRRRLNLSEQLFESPTGDAALVLYHIGEIGLDCQVGHLVVLKQKQNPRVAWQDGRATYWYTGEHTVRWTEGRALLYECKITHDAHGATRRHYSFRFVVLDVEHERMAVWEQDLDRAFPIGIDGGRALFDGSASPDHGPLVCDLERLSWRPFGHWQG
jgi:hypothetical protein